ncbi:neurocan core protein-like isoform X3 [Branchiostoma floridae x Branchiostoma belcheri]
MGDHIVMCPEQNDDPCSDPYYKPQETDADKKHEEKRFSIKERIMGMWNKAKSSKICWVLLGCGILVIVSVVTAVVLSAYIKPGSKKGKDALKPSNVFGLRLTNSSARASTIFYKENDSFEFLANTTPFRSPQNCQQDIDECNRNPCQHGRCVNQDGGYKCTCSPGWSGQNCQQDIDECTSKPCQHGRCVNKAGGYKCTCTPGWTGKNCQQEGQCSGGWTGYNIYCYRFEKNQAKFHKAHTDCRRQGANLASITSPEENRLIVQLISKAPKTVWIGLRRGRNSWIWTDGTPLTYENWRPGEPNNRPKMYDLLKGGENCVYMDSKGGGNLFKRWGRGGWNDSQCKYSHPFICKKQKS